MPNRRNPPRRPLDPRERLRAKGVNEDRQPADDDAPNEDELADEMARLMGSRQIDDSEPNEE